MALTIYGAVRSRAARNMWLCGELGLDYENEAITPADASAHPGLRAVNPNGRVPAIDDDGVAMFESLAINLYLAKKHGGSLAPKDVVEDGHATMWSMWVATECETSALQVLLNRAMLPEAERSEAKVTAAMDALKKPLGVLEEILSTRDNLVGGRFTVADLNVASVLIYLVFAKADLTPWPRVASWVAACWERPAAAAVLAKRTG